MIRLRRVYSVNLFPENVNFFFKKTIAGSSKQSRESLGLHVAKKTLQFRLHGVELGSHVDCISMSVVFVRRWLVAFLIAIGIILIVALSLRKVSFSVERIL